MSEEYRDILDALYQVILDRRARPDEKSYTASLYAKGLDKILGKIGEEATELAVAGKGGDKGEIVGEAATSSTTCWFFLPITVSNRSRSMPNCAAASVSRDWPKRRVATGKDGDSNRLCL